MKHIFLAIAFLLSSHIARSAPIGAVVQTWHHDPQTNVVTVTIANISQKDITGYNLTIKETYADGTINTHELLSDFVGSMLLMEEVKGTPQEVNLRKQVGDGVLHPNAVRDEKLSISSPNLTNYEATVDAVAYADDTGEATNKDALQRIVTHRQAEAASLKKVNEVITSTLTSSNDPHPHVAVVKQLQDVLTTWNAQTHHTIDMEPGILQGAINEFGGFSKHPEVNEQDYFQRYVAQHEKRRAALSSQAQLVRKEAP